MKGYSSHGNWSTLGEIRRIEKERNNNFPDLPYSGSIPAIWVCRTKRKALRYLALAEDWDTIDDATKPLPKRLRKLLNEITEVTFQPNDIAVMNDGDEGYLIIRVS